MLFLSEIFPMKAKKSEAHPAYVAKVPNISFGQLLGIPPIFIFIFLFIFLFLYFYIFKNF